jgi:hypothetical protein
VNTDAGPLPAACQRWRSHQRTAADKLYHPRQQVNSKYRACRVVYEALQLPLKRLLLRRLRLLCRSAYVGVALQEAVLGEALL